MKKRASICGKIKVLKLKNHTKEPSISIVNTLSLESNIKIKINFDGGDLSSDAGLLLIKEFVSKLGIDKLFGQSFKTNDSALFRYHTDKENLLQMIYMIITGYFEDDTSDELTNDNKVDYAVVYGEFMYRSGPCPYKRHVVCKIEKPENQMAYMYTFIVTNMEFS